MSPSTAPNQGGQSEPEHRPVRACKIDTHGENYVYRFDKFNALTKKRGDSLDKWQAVAVREAVETANNDQLELLARIALSLERIEDTLGQIYEFLN